MSVYMSMRAQGDAAKLKELATGEWRERMLEIGERAKSMGAIHHRFATANGEIVVMDEWESREQFERFFAESHEIGELMQAAGVRSEPQITFLEPLDLGDEF